MSRRTPTGRRPAVLCAVLAGSALAAACAASPAERAGLRPGLPAPAAETAETAALVDEETVLTPQSSLYGLFLAGEAALEKGSSREAARYLGLASERAPDAGFLKERAFTAALVSGDVVRAAAIAPAENEAGAPTFRLGQLTKAGDLMAEDRGKEAMDLLTQIPPQGATGSAALLMQPWAAAVAGDWATATSPVTTENRINRMFATLTRARLLERARKYAEADAVFKSLTAEQDSGLFALSYGAFLERRGRRADAVAVYERSIGVSGDPMLEHARNRARRGRAPAIGSLEEGAAETLLAPAALQLTRRQPEIALALLRLVLRLDPTHDEAWMLVGDAMSAAGDAAASREAYTKVRPSSPEYIVAQGRLAWSLQREGNSDGALKLAELQIDRSKGSAQALSVYAELLRENGRFLESVAVMDKLIARAEEAPEAWRLYYFRGVSYERAGQWEKAEADLQHALSLKSDEPEVMNYLGYGWADRGERLAEALAMLEKAATLRPRSGEIRDSLGWARYRLGLYPEAVQDLERAVAMAPADPNINDHLGDAYWMVGRRLEAEFQWRRVLTLEPSPELRAAVEVKLKHGIEGASPSALAAADLRQ